MSRPATTPTDPTACFRRDEGGFVLVFFAVCIPALIGLVGLAIDGARLMTLDTQLASVADAAALAAASRLDRSPTAIPAARQAAGALGNTVAMAGSGGGIRVGLRFGETLSDLRRNSSLTLGPPGSERARYVEATTAESSLTTSFLQLLGARASPIRRRAIAESQYYACDVSPAILCQPDPAAFVAKARPGRQYLLRYDGTRNTGSIALLDRPDASEGRQTLRAFASGAPEFCYAEGVRLRTNLSPAEFDQAINIRFDRYQSRAGPVPPDLAVYPPAPNVLKGRYYQSCLSPPEGASINPPIGLPRDSAYQGIVLRGFWDQGGGDWKTSAPSGGTGGSYGTALEEYIGWNHADKPTEFRDRLRNARTRYDLYLAELGRNRQTETLPVDTRGYGASVATMPSGGPAAEPHRENPVPICYAGNQRPIDPRRRVVYLTVADCGAFPEAATAANLSRRVAKFFLTDLSDLGATLVEFVQMLRPDDDDGKLRHVVQLVTTD